MTVVNKFNLVREPWVPIAGSGLVSLEDIFTRPGLPFLGGNPVQKIAMLKLLLAIVQSSFTPADEDELEKCGPDGMAAKAASYLKEHEDLFWLYGSNPFLQMPQIMPLIERAREKELKNGLSCAKRREIEEKFGPKAIGFGDVPDVFSENNTVLTQNQTERLFTDAERALLVVTLMNFALGGKRVIKGVEALSTGTEKSDSAKSGPSLGNYVGYLHSFLHHGEDLRATLWMNLFTKEQIFANRNWSSGLGTAPWEAMPAGEDCGVARELKHSYMGALVGFSRFVLLADSKLYYIEGLQYPSHKNGWREPTMAIQDSDNKLKILWVNPAKKPWREITSLLAFLSHPDGFDCQQIRVASVRAKKLNEFIVWSGGMRVRVNAGEQSIKQDDDFVESTVRLESKCLGSHWFILLKREMTALDDLSKTLMASVQRFLRMQKSNGKQHAKQACELFWQLCEKDFQRLVDACNEKNTLDAIKGLRQTFSKTVDLLYNRYCPRDTPRQLEAWAANRPNLKKYLSELEGEVKHD